MRNARRLLLYVFGAFFLIFGLVGLFDPVRLIYTILLRPTGYAGFSELRGLYGGGFIGFGLVIIAGLRWRAHGAGLLLAMSIIIGCVVIGRLISLVLDGAFPSCIFNTIFETI